MDFKSIKPEALTDISVLLQSQGRACKPARKLQEIADYSYLHPGNMALDSITELSGQMGFILRHWCVLPSISGSADSVNCSGFTDRICAVSHLATARLDHIDNVASEDVLAAILICRAFSHCTCGKP